MTKSASSISISNVNEKDLEYRFDQLALKERDFECKVQDSNSLTLLRIESPKSTPQKQSIKFDAVETHTNVSELLEDKNISKPDDGSSPSKIPPRSIDIFKSASYTDENHMGNIPIGASSGSLFSEDSVTVDDFSNNSIRLNENYNHENKIVMQMAEELARFLVSEGIVGDNIQERDALAALEIKNLIRRENEVTIRENELFNSVCCIFIAISISFLILFSKSI